MTDESTPEKTGERLQRVLSARGVASRRAAETMITDGRVEVNGKIITALGTRVDPDRADIRVDGKPIPRPKPRYIVMNKPAGFITTVSDERQRWTVMDLLQVPERMYPIGRLDRETQGLLLFTNDGDVANRVMHPRYRLTKEYHVITNARPSDGQLQEVRDGILIEDKLVVPDECRLLRETTEGIVIRLVIHEGMYHVVRQMMDKVGIEVVKLRRQRVGPISLTGIPLGAWRDLTPGEVEQLFEAIDLPRKRADEVNATRKLQLEPMGGYSPKPRIRHPKRYAEVSRHNAKLAAGSHSREGRGFGRPPAEGNGRTRTSGKPGSRGGSNVGKARPSQSDRHRRTRSGR